MRRFSASDFRGYYYAHRGLYNNDRGIPENSLPAFRAAAEKGYGTELDVQLSADGHVVVFHDDTLDRVCGVRGRISDFSLADLRNMHLLDTDETIPLLTDALRVLQEGSGPLIVELKSGSRNKELCEKTRDILLKYPGVFCIESFDPRIVRWFRKTAPDVFRGQLSQPAADYGGLASAPLARLMAGCRFSFLTRPDFIAYKIGPRPKKVLRMRRKGILLVAWTSLTPEKDAGENDAVIFEDASPPPRCAKVRAT